MAIDMIKAAEAKMKSGGDTKKTKKPKTDDMPIGDEQMMGAGMDAGMGDIPPPLDLKLENALDLMTDIQQDLPANSEPANQIAGMIKQLTAILTKISGETPQAESEVPEGPASPLDEATVPGAEKGAFPASPTGAGGVTF